LLLLLFILSYVYSCYLCHNREEEEEMEEKETRKRNKNEENKEEGEGEGEKERIKGGRKRGEWEGG
jgi:hypothetical protein